MKSLNVWGVFLFKGHFAYQAVIAESMLPTKIWNSIRGREIEKECWVPMPTECRRGSEGQQGLRRMHVCPAGDAQHLGWGPLGWLGLWPRWKRWQKSQRGSQERVKQLCVWGVCVHIPSSHPNMHAGSSEPGRYFLVGLFTLFWRAFI